MWDMSDDMPQDELKGPALYEALMAVKPRNWSEYEWAEKAAVSRTWFADLKRKPDASPRSANLTRVLNAANLTMADLYAPKPGTTEGRQVERTFGTIDLPRDVPILGTATGADLEVTDNGETSRIEKTLVEPESLGYARRPPSIARNRKVYALFVTGDSMIPRFRPGDLVYVDPRREPNIHDDVIVQLIDDARTDADPAEVQSVLIKTLVRRTASHFYLCQHNPATEFRVARSRIAAVHRIIPLSELLS